MTTNWYRETVEALGMRGNRNPIRNKLNRVRAHTEDKKLRSMVSDVMERLDRCDTNTDHTSVKDMKSVNAKELVNYCMKQGHDS